MIAITTRSSINVNASRALVFSQFTPYTRFGTTHCKETFAQPSALVQRLPSQHLPHLQNYLAGSRALKRPCRGLRGTPLFPKEIPVNVQRCSIGAFVHHIGNPG